MPLLRAQKETLVENLVSELESSRISLIFEYKNLNSKANLELRDAAFQDQGKIKMISNNLLRLVLKRTKRDLELPERQLAIAYGFSDEIKAAKLLTDFSKRSNSLELIAGWIDDRFFLVGDLTALSGLPGREALLGQVVGRLGGLIQGLVYGLNYPIQKLAYVVSAVEQNKR